MSRLVAIIVADLHVRLRRRATLAIMLVLCVLPYRFVAPVAAGRAPMVVDGHRALLSSGAIALATACLGSILLAMLGFYLVSSTIRRDTISRVGSIIAATPVRNGEYLAGKFLGNVLILGLIAGFYMLNVMGLHLLRAEEPLEPLVYVSTFAAVMGPAVVVVSALALLFECARPLAGRVGDVAYFGLWSGMVSLTALRDRLGAVHWFDFTDVLGMLFMLRQVSDHGRHHEINVGNIAFDPAQPAWDFAGLHWDAISIATRLGTTLLALPVLYAAWLLFARFDPARIRVPAGRERRSLAGEVNRLLKPLSGAMMWLLPRTPGGLAGSALREATLTVMLMPVLAIGAPLLALWGATAAMGTLRHVILPATFAALVPVVADVAVRDTDAGTRAFLWTAPGLQPRYYLVKVAAASLLAVLLVSIPLIRVAAHDRAWALSLLVGTLFTATLAISLGRISGGAKLFAGTFLLFLYLSLSVSTVPAFDFAGWNGVATDRVRATYAMVTIALAGLAAMRVPAAGAVP